MRILKAVLGFHVLALGALLSRAFAHGTASEVADKWATNLGNAQTEMQNGVNRVQTAPGQQAAAKKQKWINAMTSQHVQNKWATNVAGVSLQSWKDSMNNIGIQRAVSGAAAKKPKFVRAMTVLLPYIDQVTQQVRAMPDNTPADREQRMLAQVRGMRNFPGVGGGA